MLSERKMGFPFNPDYSQYCFSERPKGHEDYETPKKPSYPPTCQVPGCGCAGLWLAKDDKNYCEAHYNSVFLNLTKSQPREVGRKEKVL